MVPRRLESGSAPRRRFFLDPSPLEGTPELSSSEAEHALRVLRLQPGDQFIGLDGRGRSWPICVRAVEKKRARLECVGEPEVEARAGEPDAALDWIEIALALPRGGRAEEIVDGLTQLGVAAISPIATERTQPEARQVSGARLDRLRRVTIESCKQSGRLWLPLLTTVRPLTEWIDAHPIGDTLVLSPTARIALSDWLASRIEAGRTRWSASRPLRIVIGPEGGFSAEEEELLRERGALCVRLGPHTLRIETAALAAMSIASELSFKARRT